MDNEIKILLSLLGVILGFALSQSMNIINFLRRPRFKVEHFGDGVISSYTGDPPETPSEIIFGFHLKNTGFLPAKNIRILISNLKTKENETDDWLDSVMDIVELAKPIDFLPPGEVLRFALGIIDSRGKSLSLYLENDIGTESGDFVESDTRGKNIFSADFHIICDNKGSYDKISLSFYISEDLREMINEDNSLVESII